MPTFHKETKNKASVLKIDLSYYFSSSSRGAFRALLTFFRKWLTTLRRKTFSQKAPSQMSMFVVTEFLHGFHKTI